MSYATVDDLIERYGEQELILLTDTTNSPPAEIDQSVVSEKLADADAEINSYLRARMTTPVNPVPRILVPRACAIARYFLHSTHATDQVKADYQAAIAWLQAVQAGTISLGDDQGATAPPSVGTPQVSAPARVFTSDTLKGL